MSGHSEAARQRKIFATIFVVVKSTPVSTNKCQLLIGGMIDESV